MTFTTDQIKDIADDLDALSDELGSRNWNQELSAAVMSAAAGSLVSVAAMRAPVPQQALYPPPPSYGYGPEDYRPGPQQSVPLQVTVTGSTRGELEDRAMEAGKQVFGEDAILAVTLNGAIVPAGHSRDSEAQYTCGAYVRQEEPLVTPR